MSDKKIPNRSCISCRKVQKPDVMFRVAMNKDGNFALDKDKKNPGRGAYLCRNITCINTMNKKHSLDRAFKTKLPDVVYDDLSKEMSDLIAE